MQLAGQTVCSKLMHSLCQIFYMPLHLVTDLLRGGSRMEGALRQTTWWGPNGVFKGGVQGVQTPPPPEIFLFFLKSEGKEIEIKIKKRDVGGGGGGYLLTYFWS